MKVLIVLPSYNERANILSLIDEILEPDPARFVCVVDDASPDGAGDAIESAIHQNPLWKERVHLIRRQGKGGRGSAIREGFFWGTSGQKDFDSFIEMDCDFSHDPKAIQQGLSLLRDGTDAVFGVRYPGGTIIGWPWTRRLFSFFANTLARALIDRSIADYTNGFRFYTRRAVRVILDHPQKHAGYIYLSETLVYLLQAGIRIRVFPITFRNRERGVSNTTSREIASALSGIFSIAWDYHFSRE